MQLLGKRKGHKSIAQVNHQLGQGHFQKRRPCSDHRDACKLACRSQVGQRDENGLKRRQSAGNRLDAKSDAHRKIPKPNGDSVPEAL